MATRIQARWFFLVALLAGASGCGGGGGLPGANTFVSLTIEGVVPPLANQACASGPFIPGNVALNAEIVFRFGGPVDPASIPNDGPAVESINITPSTDEPKALVASGRWTLDAGDAAILRFRPSAPANPADFSSRAFSRARRKRSPTSTRSSSREVGPARLS